MVVVGSDEDLIGARLWRSSTSFGELVARVRRELGMWKQPKESASDPTCCCADLAPAEPTITGREMRNLLA